MANLISIILLLFLVLAIIVTLLEKYGSEPSPEKLQKLSRWIVPLMGILIVVQGFRYFLG